MLNARTAETDAVMIFFMVDDPPGSLPSYRRVPLLTWIEREEFSNQNG